MMSFNGLDIHGRGIVSQRMQQTLVDEYIKNLNPNFAMIELNIRRDLYELNT